MIIEHDATGKIQTLGNAQFPVDVILRYSSEDPLAVIFDFNVTGDWDESIKWHFGRRILADAIETGRLAGSLDVKALYEGGDVPFTIFLDSPEGTAAIHFDPADMLAFVREIFEAVPEDATDKIIEDELALFLDGLGA